MFDKSATFIEVQLAHLIFTALYPRGQRVNNFMCALNYQQETKAKVNITVKLC